MRRPCTCGRPIYRGKHGRLAGPGVAKFWVVTLDRSWRHLDGTEACDPPAPGRLRTQTGHTRVDTQFFWLVFVVVFIVVGLRLLGMAL